MSTFVMSKTVGAGFHPCPEERNEIKMKTSEKLKRNNVEAVFVSARKENGITLVALIITIIVMLILVGVSVQVVINSNLIGTAQDAANRTETAYEEEGSNGEITVGDKTYLSIEDYIAKKEKYEIAITSAEQIYALGRLINKNTCAVAGLTSYSGSEQEATDLSLFEIPEEYTTNEQKIAFLQTTSYGLENNIIVTLQRKTGTDCFLGIGGTDNPFKGTFNGTGKTITILGSTINANLNFATGVGLFGKTENAKIVNLNIALENDITIKTALHTLGIGLLVGQAYSTEISDVAIKMDGYDINVDFNSSTYREGIFMGSMAGYISNTNISNCKAELINSSITLTNNNEDDEHLYDLGGLIGKSEFVNNINSCNVRFENSKIGFYVENTGAVTGYGSATGGIIGFAGPGSDNTENIGRNGTTITNCNFISNNSQKQEIIYAKENYGASPNSGGIVGLAFNNCSIINSSVDITNGIIISQRLLENVTTAKFGSTSGGVIGRLEHTGIINGCIVTGNNLDIIAESTERDIYSGGIVGYDMGPYHKNQISLVNNKVIGNGTTTVKVKLISENGNSNRYIAAGGIAGCSTYIVKDCDVSGITISNIGSNSASKYSAIGNVVGWKRVSLTAQWSTNDYFEPSTEIGILNCTSQNVTLSADNDVVATGEVYGLEY